MLTNKNTKNFKPPLILFYRILFFILSLCQIKIAFAETSQTPQSRLNAIASQAEYPTTGPAAQSIIVNIIIYALGFLGAYFLILIIVSGVQWMTAGGNEEKITKARTRLINAVIGFAIVMAAYAITTLVNKIFNLSIQT